MKSPKLPQLAESLLFAAGSPLSAAQLAEVLDVAEEDVVAALDTLSADLATSGLRLSQLEGQYQLVTAPEAAGAVERYLSQEARSELSRPALETLAIVIYQQPVTKLQIEEIRGIASDQMIRNLLQRDLITVRPGASHCTAPACVYCSTSASPASTSYPA
jgi:segregation and condensation protein B